MPKMSNFEEFLRDMKHGVYNFKMYLLRKLLHGIASGNERRAEGNQALHKKKAHQACYPLREG